MHAIPIAAVALAVTAGITILALNLRGSDEIVEPELVHQYTLQDEQFLRAMGTMLGPPVLTGNRIQTLVNGDEIFPSMLTAIAAAQQTINFETYIYWGGDVGARFAEALAERSRAGIKVRVLVDWVGSQKLDEKAVQIMQDAGVMVKRYRPLRWYHLGRMNNRTHRKLLIVDGKLGFTGGVGIADKWQGNAQTPEHWRDTHYRAEGPVVGQMQSVFLDNWMKVTGEVLYSEEHFPTIVPTGASRAQLFSSSPGGGGDSMRLMYLMLITAASRTIHLSASYFVPDDLTIRHLLDARKRGVAIAILVPGDEIDATIVRNASRARWGDLLEAGVRIYEYQPTMFHCKVLVVDGVMVSVGSTNFDPRSFGLNDEANLNIFDPGFAVKQEQIFAADLSRAREITYAEWKERPFMEKLREHAASLLGSQL